MSAAHHSNGYARVSSREQNLDRQLAALEAFGVERVNVYADKASGKDFERPAEKGASTGLREREGGLSRGVPHAGAGGISDGDIYQHL